MSCGNLLKSKVYFLVCPFHKNRKKKKVLSSTAVQQKLQKKGLQILLRMDFDVLAKEIADYNFEDYASLLVFVECSCFHYNLNEDLFSTLFKSIKLNTTLRFVTKLFICMTMLQLREESLPDDDENSDSVAQLIQNNEKMKSLDEIPCHLRLPFLDELSDSRPYRNRIHIACDINTNESEEFSKVISENLSTYQNYNLLDWFRLKKSNKGLKIKFCKKSNKDIHIQQLQMSEQKNVPEIDNFTLIQCFQKVKTYDFSEYASLLLFAEFTCFHYTGAPLDAVYKAIEKNDTLKYVTKLVMCFSTLHIDKDAVEWKESPDGESESECDNDKMPKDLYIPFYELIDPKLPFSSPIVLKQDIRTSIYVTPNNKNAIQKFTNKEVNWENVSILDILNSCEKSSEIVMQIHPQKETFLEDLQASEQDNVPNIDHFTFIQCLQQEFSSTRTFVNMIYDYMIDYAHSKPVQEIAKLFCSDICSERYSDQAYYNTTCAGAGYIFHMNPALTFFINHITCFPRGQPDRLRAKSDTPVLQRTYMKKKIQFYTLLDGGLEDVHKLMQKLRTTNFSWLKYLYIFISSHGDIDDIIYTKSGTYSIQEDIVKPLLANKTLENAQKFILVNACRGEIDPTKMYESVEEIQQSMKDNKTEEKLEYFHDEKLMIIYSTQKGFVSLLYEEGAIFLQTFCEVFDEHFEETSMEVIGQKIIERMNEIIFGDQVPDIGPYRNTQHKIKMEFVNSFSNRKALKNIARFFRNKFQNNNDI